MKTFSSSQLSKKPAEVLAAAREDGAIIQIKRTNGEVIEEFLLLKGDRSDDFISFGNGGIVMNEDIT